MLKITLITLTALIILGAFFVQWANKPENVTALLKAREQEKKQAIADSLKAIEDKKQQQLNNAVGAWKEVEIQKKTDAELQLVVDENFKNNQLEYLENPQSAIGMIKDNTLIYSNIAYKKTSVESILALTKKEHENFVAEMETEISGDALSIGILFNYTEGRKKTMFGAMDTWKADRVSSSLQSILLRVNDEDETENLVSLKEVLTLKSIPEQKIRLEKKGKHLKVTVNGKIIFDKTIDQYSASKGKLGIVVSKSNSTNWNRNVMGTIKTFKVWTW